MHRWPGEILLENVPVEVVEYRLSEKQRLCPECGTLMTEIGKDVEHVGHDPSVGENPRRLILHLCF
ncbi:MAG: hypothetical protein LKK00_10205 [Intestinimonas sp.]|jgi:hypothetical protein|nr:hypothetical protein [Intestinimonas sp.]